MKKMFNIISIIVLFFNSCKKECPPVVIEDPKSISPLIWSYTKSDAQGLSTSNFIFKNKLIQGFEINGKARFIAFTLDSGKIVWESDFLLCKSYSHPDCMKIEDSLMVFMEYGYVYVINLNNGKTVWYDKDNSREKLSIIKNKIYTYADDGDHGRMLQYDLLTGQKKAIFTLYANQLDGFEPYVTPPDYWKHPNGDDILVFGNRSWAGGQNDRYDYLAFNLTADSMLWYKKGNLEFGSTVKPLVFENKAIYYVQGYVRCLNTLNGDLIWEFKRVSADNTSSFISANITMWNGILIAKPDSDFMYGLDINTGKVLWTNSKTSSMPSPIRIALNKIWYCSAGINCFDAQTGKTLIYRYRYNNSGSYLNSISIDEKTGYIYTVTNRNTVLCLDSKKLLAQ